MFGSDFGLLILLCRFVDFVAACLSGCGLVVVGLGLTACFACVFDLRFVLFCFGLFSGSFCICGFGFDYFGDLHGLVICGLEFVGFGV